VPNLAEQPTSPTSNSLVEKVPLRSLPAQPLVSILIPSFNQGSFIRATLESIFSQDYRPLEIWVIDGKSTDGTLDVLQSYADRAELKWISEPDEGVVDAVNKGFARVSGDVVAIQSSDDCYLPGALSRAVGEFRDQPDLGLLYGDTVKVTADGRDLSRHRIGPYSLENVLLFRTWIPQPSTFFRRELLDALGGWDPRIPYAPDTDLWIRMAFRTEVRKVDAYFSQRRMHEAQRDTQAAKIVRDFSLMIDQSEDIRCAPPQIRRAAQAAKHLIRVRYNPPASDLYRAWHLLCAGWQDRRALQLGGILRHATLPARRLASKVKQRVLATRRRQHVVN